MRAAALTGLIAVAAVGTAWLLLPEAFPSLTTPTIAPAPQPSQPPAATAAAPTAPLIAATPPPQEAAAPAIQPPEAPHFDVARVSGRGMLVAAGRAAPGAEVILREGERELGRGRADRRGEWVILPAEPLAPGARELTLLAQSPGQESVPGRETVLLVVPDPPSALADRPALSLPGESAGNAAAPPGQPGALAVLLPPTTGQVAPRLLQTPGTADRQRLGLDVVDYDDTGAMRFAGRAQPGSTVRVYVGPRHAGDAVADAGGRWTLIPPAQPEVGRHTLRLDQLASQGGVADRIEVPFQRDAVSPQLVQDSRMVVQPGQNLWRIARGTYGRGIRYTVIYQANREQIRDPARIYPGQVFSVPESAPQPATAAPVRRAETVAGQAMPESSSRSR